MVLTFSFGQSAGVGVNQSQLKMLREEREMVSFPALFVRRSSVSGAFRLSPLGLTRSLCWPWTWGPGAGGSPWPGRSLGQCTAPPGMLWSPYGGERERKTWWNHHRNKRSPRRLHRFRPSIQMFGGFFFRLRSLSAVVALPWKLRRTASLAGLCVFFISLSLSAGADALINIFRAQLRVSSRCSTQKSKKGQLVVGSIFETCHPHSWSKRGVLELLRSHP